MTKPAHIINLPNVEVGDKALTVCGVKHLVRVRWEDLPDDHPICRECVDRFIIASNDVNQQVGEALRDLIRLQTTLDTLTVTLTDQNTMTDILDETAEYAAKRIEKAEKKKRKQAEKNAKSCTCLWVDGERVQNEECPVHGVPVAPPVGEGYQPKHRAGDDDE
jgi:hypothetical protein